MNRRKRITLLGSAAAWPLAARAQQTDRVRRIGILMPYAANDPEAQLRVKTFEAGLRELGWAEGRNLRIEFRWAQDDPGRLRNAAAELVAMNPDVILANGTPVLAALRQESTTQPIVFVQVTDPVGTGFVPSLARPGGNITGFSTWEFSIGGKWLEMLKEIAPALTQVAVVFSPQTAPYAPAFLGPIEAAASSLAVESMAAPASDGAGIEAAVDAFAHSANGGLMVLPDVTTTNHRDLIVALAARYRLPAIYPFRFFAASGGLMSYGASSIDPFRRAAGYVDRILQGEKPSDLPVQAPTKYELVINLKTAKAFGLTVPLIMQMTADEVIE